MADFAWPWQYNFPPFFTIQPNLETRKKQLEAWCALVLDYHRQNKSYSVDVTEIQSAPLFCNKKLDRKLSIDGIYMVLEELRKQGHIEWKDPKTKKQGLLMWRTPEEWGKLIYSWVSSKSMQNSVCTLYELSEGEDSEGTEFHGLEKWLLLRALQALQDQGKAEIINFDGNEGVKFF
uniref:Vacuolar protein-sorting-associated protein 25 n=1 Tax=Magallana gigas TaxID=29159 RepID=K1P359_MAGGI|eukprot:XP_011418343.1 PREDICTED: vacuolar protein-sorting-associated protein 25 [Crassostrea gigas]